MIFICFTIVDLPLSPDPEEALACQSRPLQVARRTQQQDLAFSSQSPRVLLQLLVNSLASLLLLHILSSRLGAPAGAHGDNEELPRAPIKGGDSYKQGL